MFAPMGPCRRLLPLAVAALLVSSAGDAARAQPPSGREIMQRVDARDDGDRAVQDMEMLLIDQNGGTRTRRLRMWRRDVGKDIQTILFFLAPADVKDTGFLTYDFGDPDRDDDQWLYLPALKKSKRIATADKSGSFVGSDFSYADLTKRPLDRYDYRLLEAGEQEGVAVWFVEAIPNHPAEIDETGYTKVRYAVRRDNWVVVGATFVLKRGGREKHFTVTKLEQIDGIWTPTSMQMATAKGDVRLHETRLELTHVRFGQPMDDTRFSVRQLEKGP
jgi:hypothetical protein